MQDNLDDLVKFLNPLVQQLSSSEMTKLNKKIGKDLRRNQQQRISGQKNPDGSAYTPRRLRDGQRLRKKMFTKLRSLKYLRNFSNAEKVSVGFLSSAVFVAKIHQEGLRGGVAKNGPFITYPKRELLGFSESDIKMIKDSVLDHFDKFK